MVDQPGGISTAPDKRGGLILIGAGLLCFADAAVTIHFTTDSRSLATIWAADAVILALMLNRPSMRWPPLLIAGFVAIVCANAVTRHLGLASFGFAAADMGEVLIAAVLIRPYLAGRSVLGASGAAWPFLLACGAAPSLSAGAGAWIASRAFGQPFDAAYTTWLFSHGLGLLLFTPVFASIARGDYVRAVRATDLRTGMRMLVLLAITGLTAMLVFRFAHLPVLFLTYVPVMLITFRVGRIGTELAVLLTAIIGATCTVAGTGPIASLVIGSQNQAHFFQLYLATLLFTAMPVAAELNARRVLTKKLAQSERAVKLLAANSADALLAFDANGICRNAAGAAERLLARSADQLVGTSAELLAAQEGAAELVAAMAAARADPGMTAICEFRSAATPYLWLEASLTSANEIEGGIGEDAGIVATIRDVTERNEREAALSRLARTDGLTGALNRVGFLEALDELGAGDPGHPYALAAIDIDHFKQINDKLGHQAGDAALQQLARVLASCVRRGDAVGRMGGDEFMIALRATDVVSATTILARLTETVHGTIFTLRGGGALRLSISCGIAPHRPGEHSEVTRQAADEALYQAKRAGRNQVSVAA